MQEWFQRSSVTCDNYVVQQVRGLETMDAGQQQKEQLGSSSKQTVWVHLPSRPVLVVYLHVCQHAHSNRHSAKARVGRTQEPKLYQFSPACNSGLKNGRLRELSRPWIDTCRGLNATNPNQ